MKPVIVIPAYKPEEELLTLVDALSAKEFPIIVINDGSGPSYHHIFAELEKKSAVKVLYHAINLGKGQALKTAFNYFLVAYPEDSPGVITADADGQHLVADILQVAQQFSAHPQHLWLGIRAFQGEVPFRSRFGNNLTRMVFKLFVGHSLQDTQTGLRAIPRQFLLKMLKTSANGYDFELDMLIRATRQKIKIGEVPIQTVYKNQNKGSHFNPIKDSLKIYFVFFRFLIFAIISGLFDFASFSLIFMLSGHILFSETLARLFSGTLNFLFNKGIVFKSKHGYLPEAIKYAFLCLLNIPFSFGLITSLSYLGVNIYLSKILALFGLFIANFIIQQFIVFGRKEEELLL